jgi:outer membrane protein TolC
MAETRRWKTSAAMLSAALLAGCNLAPAYHKPAFTTPVAYGDMGPWTPASPNDAAPRGNWWVIYNDPVLNTLEARIDSSNPDLASALARYQEAQQTLNEVTSQEYPVVDVNGNDTQNKQSANRPLREGQGPNQYQNDEITSAADAASIRLSLEAQLADAYFSLRGLDAQAQLLTTTGADYAQALALTQAQHSGGIVSGLDVGRAQSQYDSAAAQLSDAVAQRALYLHEIAALVGVAAPDFSLPAVPALPAPPVVPVAPPSDLLQRRPDIAEAEREAAAANAQIGVARAAFFPTLDLDAQGGWQADGGGVNLFDAKNTLWSLGPGLALTLFDGGERRAADRLAVEQFNAASANYRSVVLTAFQQVEDNLVLCNQLAQEAAQENQAVQAAANTTSLSTTLYQDGAVTYLDVVTAQTAQLQAQQSALSIATRRLQASVNLIQALGGGWTPQS